MGIPQLIEGYDRSSSPNQTTYEPPFEHSLLSVVTGFLDTALQMWDDDHIQAKSQVRVAASMLRGYTVDSRLDTNHPIMPTDLRGLAPWQARKVTEFIDASLDSTIRLRDCASKVRLSASYFGHAFKVTFGITVRHYIRRRRVERAQQLMILSQEPLSQIALACGFADQAHYCRVFRELVGSSPNTWRRRNMSLAPGD